MTRKVFIISFITALTAGLLIVADNIFFYNKYPFLNIPVYILIGVILILLSLILLKSVNASYSVFRLVIFTLLITTPLIPVISNGYIAFFKEIIPVVSEKKAEIDKSQIIGTARIQEQAHIDKPFHEKIILFMNNFKKINNFPQESEIFFNNHFPFRESIGRIYNNYTVRTFKKSSNNKAIIGESGWLFYKGDDVKQTIDDYTGKRRFSKNELEIIRTRLEGHAKNLANKNIQFWILIAPNKESIYGEFLPGYYFKDKTSKLEQVKKYLQENHSTVRIIDIKEKMLEEKRNQKRKYPLYFKTDTHWNDSGAYIAYSVLLSHLNIKPIDEKQFIQKDFIYSGDIVKTMLNCDGLITENSSYYEPKILRSAKITDQNNEDFVTIINNSNLPRAVIYRDSFARNLQPFVSEHFSRIAWQYKYKIDMELMNREKPDFVILEVAERYLDRFLKI